MTIATTRSNTAVDIKLEVVVIPVSDVDRAKLFYAGLGWRLDADLIGDEFHVIQFTPPGSQCSVVFGSGVAPGPYARIELDILETAGELVVSDIEAARAELADRGVDVSEVYHYAGEQGRVSGATRMPGTPMPLGATSRPSAACCAASSARRLAATRCGSTWPRPTSGCRSTSRRRSRASAHATASRRASGRPCRSKSALR